MLAQAPNRSGPLLHDEERRDSETSYTLTGEKVAAVDAQSSDQPRRLATDYSQMLHLVQERWRTGRSSGASTSCRTAWSSGSPTSSGSTAP
ncbi:hypothetical protein SMICM17S_03535 [Streptomyces microflavus]